MASIIQVGIVRVGNDPLLQVVPIPNDYWVVAPKTVLVTGSAATLEGLAAPANLVELGQLAWYVSVVGDEAVQVSFNSSPASDTNGFLMGPNDARQFRCTTPSATVSVKSRAVA